MLLPPLLGEVREKEEESGKVCLWSQGCRVARLGQSFYSLALEAISFGVLQSSSGDLGKDMKEVQKRDSSQVAEEKRAKSICIDFCNSDWKSIGRENFPQLKLVVK